MGGVWCSFSIRPTYGEVAVECGVSESVVSGSVCKLNMTGSTPPIEAG